MKFSLIFASCFLIVSTSFQLYQDSGVVEPLDNSLDSLLDSSKIAHEAQIELGKYLFYEKALSRDSTISCATCHKQELAFTDGLPTSIGIREQKVSRNAPTLTNVMNRPYFLLDGVNPSLEAQSVVPIQEHKEFDFNIYLIINRLKQNKRYVDLAKNGFGSEITAYVYSKSIAEFERTLISYNSSYDQYLNGNKEALTISQKRGEQLFLNELYCSDCHNGSDFTNDALLNNGLYVSYLDSGRMRLTGKEIDRGVFKVPTLRNIEVTSPYMHDGSLETLEQVVEHYTSGGFSHKAKGKSIVSFEISNQDKIDLINFLKSLTDQSFIENPKFRIEKN